MSFWYLQLCMLFLSLSVTPGRKQSPFSLLDGEYVTRRVLSRFCSLFCIVTGTFTSLSFLTPPPRDSLWAHMTLMFLVKERWLGHLMTLGSQEWDEGLDTKKDWEPLRHAAVWIRDGKVPELPRRPVDVIMDLVKTMFIILLSSILVWRKMDGRDDSRQIINARDPGAMVISDNWGWSLAIGQLGW